MYFVAFITFYMSTCFIVPSFCEGEQCLKGIYHKAKPSPESDEYKYCTPWKNLTCCTTALDNEVALEDAPEQYNDTWHLCGNLSTKCVEFWKRQECFYQCSPYVYKWKDSNIDGALNGVPICASECDDWYKACKDEKICVKNVLDGLKNCSAKYNCSTTYSEMYGSGENLCQEMWGSSYKYVKKNGNNCMKFWFTPGSENPNANVLKADGVCMRNSFIAVLHLVSVLCAVMAFNW